MTDKEEKTPNEQVTLESIEKHLKRQDRQIARGSYFSVAAVGASIVLVAVSLEIGSKVLSSSTFFWEFVFLLVCGFALMSCAWYKQHKIRNKD